MVLTREALDTGTCMVPGCTHEDHSTLAVRGRCHPKAAVKVTYVKADGTLQIVCHQCRKPVCEILVAP